MVKIVTTIIGLIFFSMNSWATVPCWQALKDLEGSVQIQANAANDVMSDDIGNIGVLGNYANQFIDQSGSLIGGAGYVLETSANEEASNASTLQSNLQIANSTVANKTNALEACLLGN